MYTAENLAAIEKAILDLQTGKRVATVTYGDTTVKYSTVDLADLLKIRNIMKSKQDNTRQVIFSTSKGLQ